VSESLLLLMVKLRRNYLL